MTFGEKEKKALVILFVLIYGYLFFTMNVKGAWPEIKENSEKIKVEQQKLDQLEADLSNIENLKRQKSQLEAANIRYEDFIAQNADMLDTLEYMEKLKRLFNNKILEVTFSPPAKNEGEGAQYYKFSTSFKSRLSLVEIKALSDFLENGVKKVKITSLKITPAVLENSSGQSADMEENKPAISDESALYEVDLQVTMYSIELGSTEKLYELARKKFEKFLTSDGIVFAPKVDSPSNGTIRVPIGNEGQNMPRVSDKSDMFFGISSFFTAGANYIFNGIDRENNEYLAFKSKEKQNITIKFNNYVYTVETNSTSGNKNSFTGVFPKRTIKIKLNDMDIPNIIENKELGASLKIINDSDFNIVVEYSSKRNLIEILDRNNTKIYNKSLTDKIFII